jgi:hypothetical protein
MTLEFNKFVDADKLEKELAVAGYPKGQKYLGLIGLPEQTTICLADNASQADIDSITNIVNAHDPAETLADAKVRRVGALKIACRDYIEGKISPPSQRSLISMMSQSWHNGLNNRAAYIEAGLEWTKGPIGYMYGVEAAIGAMTTAEEVEAATWDFAQFDASFPGTWIGGAMAILD